MKRIISSIIILCVAVFGMNVNALGTPSVGAKAAIVVNALTGGVIWSYNENKRLPMASTTKIMTAVLLLENCNLDEELTVTKEMVTVEGSSMGLLPGDKVSYRELLYGMMLPSGNDAATTVAYALAGDLKSFALMMNKKAAELKMDNTNFVTPSGLDAENHFSTASDMAKLACYAMKNSVFRKAVSTDSIRVTYGNPPYSRTLSGHNKLLKHYDGAIGIKTGYTSKAGKCLVSAANRNGVELVAVSLCDNNTVSTHTNLLNYGFSKMMIAELSLPDDKRKISVISGKRNICPISCKTAKLPLLAEEAEQVDYNISLKNFVYAPVKAGDTVGHIDWYIDGNPVKSENIYAEKTVKANKKSEYGFLIRFYTNFKLLIK